MTIHVRMPWDDSIPDGAFKLNVTTKAKTREGQLLSPFILGPLDLYDGFTARRMENAWQYAKVYKEYDNNGTPSEAYWEWAGRGWSANKAERYPMGKGAVPLYTFWDGECLSYIEARKKVYIPLYAGVVQRECAGILKRLVEQARQEDIYLLDFDAYDRFEVHDGNWHKVINDERRKMGHGFVLALILESML